MVALAASVTVLAVSAGLARAAAPQMVQEDLVTSKASSVPSANAWGANADRLVRARNGDLYTTYVARGSDSEHFRWVLAKRAAGGTRWKVVASGLTAHEPGNPPGVLISRSGTVFVVTISPWNSAGAGAPEIWDSASKRQTVVHGHWLTGKAILVAGSLYPSASIDSRGDFFIWENVPCPDFRYLNGRRIHCKGVDVPGTVYWAYRRAGTRVWHAEEWVSPYRYAYDFLLPQGPSDLRVVGTRDILEAPFEAPYPCPETRHYCFDQSVQAQWTSLNRPPTSLIVARAATTAPRYHGDHRVSAEDAYVDTMGRTHILASVSDASTHGNYESDEFVIGPSGAVQDVAYGSVPYPNLSRIVQDATGRFWIYSVGPNISNHHRCDVFIAAALPGDTDGTTLGPATVIPFASRYDCSTETRNYDVSTRSGTGLANYIDGVVATNGGADWLHYRIALPVS